jgi:2'-5' RNA ligase
MSRTRSFIAVDVSEAIRSRAADLITRLQGAEAKVSWVALPNMHITLKFLGDQTDQQLVAVCRAVQQATEQIPAFSFTCHGAGAFPNSRRPRTVWIGVTTGRDQLIELQAAIESELAGLRIPRERRGYQPHLTLGRVRGGGAAVAELGALIEQHCEFPVAEAVAGEVRVMASRLERRGAQYDVLARAPLSAR